MSQIYRSWTGIRNGQPINERFNFTTVEDVISGKPRFPVQGDHKSDWPYDGKSYQRLTADIPWGVRAIGYDSDGNKTTDFWDRDFLSRDTRLGASGSYAGEGNCISESRMKAMAKLSGKDAMQLGANIGEGKATVDMLAKPIISVLNAYRSAKRGAWNEVPGHLGMDKSSILSGQFLANRWLEYSYGWKPLLSDIHTAQQKVHEVTSKGVNLRVSATSSWSSSRDTSNYYFKRSLEEKSSAKTILKATIALPSLYEAQSWGLINPASIAWELVPFSFVIDWFAPVGNTLNAITAGAGLNFAGGSTSIKRSETFQYSRTAEALGSPHGHETGLYVEKGARFQRLPMTVFPLPEYYVDTTPWSTARAMNAAALLRGFL